MVTTILNKLDKKAIEFYTDFTKTPEKPYASIVSYIEREKKVCIEIVESKVLDGKAYVQDISSIYQDAVCLKETPFCLEKKRRFIIFTGEQPKVITPDELIQLKQIHEKKGKRKQEEENLFDTIRKKMLAQYKYRLILGHELGHIYFEHFDPYNRKNPESEKLANHFSMVLLLLRGPVLNRLSLEKIMIDDEAKKIIEDPFILSEENLDKLLPLFFKSFLESSI